MMRDGVLSTTVRPTGGRRHPHARFAAAVIALFGIALAATQLVTNSYVFFAGYVVIQYIALATAWNVLGGYAGYINFGPAAFYGAGAYLAAFLLQWAGLPLPVAIGAAGLFGAGLGLLMGAMTLRVQGVYFAIATIALVVMAETVVTNVDALGGASGMALQPPAPPAWTGGQTQYVFLVMAALALAFVSLARFIELSATGRSLRALKASEIAAECAGVPTLRLKLMICALSGGMLAIAGAPYPYYASFIEPGGAFSLSLSLNAIAMPLIGGKRTWLGPVIGAILLAGAQQVASVTISSELNILAVGIALVVFVAAAPDGLVGLLRAPGRRR